MGKKVSDFLKSEILSSVFYLAFGLCAPGSGPDRKHYLQDCIRTGNDRFRYLSYCYLYS